MNQWIAFSISIDLEQGLVSGLLASKTAISEQTSNPISFAPETIFDTNSEVTIQYGQIYRNLKVIYNYYTSNLRDLKMFSVTGKIWIKSILISFIS